MDSSRVGCVKQRQLEEHPGELARVLLVRVVEADLRLQALGQFQGHAVVAVDAARLGDVDGAEERQLVQVHMPEAAAQALHQGRLAVGSSGGVVSSERSSKQL